MIVGGKWRQMGDVDVTVDPIVLTRGGQVATGPSGPPITGDAPPLIPPGWWPWIIMAAVAGAWWWMSEEEQEEGRGDAGPFVG